MVLTVPVQIDLSSPLGWAVAAVVAVAAVWGAIGLLRHARALWRRPRRRF